MYQSLYEKVRAACCYVTVFLGDEVVSEGSGFAFLPGGQVLTAAHVVTGRMPIQRSDYMDPAQKIFCKFPGRPEAEYRVHLCGMNVDVAGFKELVQIDLAILEPKDGVLSEIDHLIANTNPPALGQRVILAGYSDELAVPFGLDSLMDGGKKRLAEAVGGSAGSYMTDMGGPIIKQGVVGNVVRGQVEHAGGTLSIDVFYVDNAVHSGASGGPVCNEEGVAVGVITQRAMTSISQERLSGVSAPSGCTVALALNPLIALAS